jgi:poly(A) polymerase
MTHDAGDQRLPSLAGAPWLTSEPVQAVLAAITNAGFEARVVGGAVRNAMLGVPVKDVDIATTALPQDVIHLAASAGLGAVPTGLSHGTVTVIAQRQTIEVTTLRRDIETFGRQARVAFTTDWAEDAARRDFTLNALYCDADGDVHDPVGGYPDLVARRVRFIGRAEDRIREDYLRILRFFRFTAAYGAGEPDAAGLAASIALADGMDQLSAERVRAELLRLLATPRAVEIVHVMAEAGLFEHLLGVRGRPDLLRRVVDIEAALDLAPDPLMRLAVLSGGGRHLTPLAARLRLSNSESERLARLVLPDPAFSPETVEAEARAFLYRFGVETFSDGVVFAWAFSDASPNDAAWRERYHLPSRWPVPVLPVRGADLLDKGLAEGPAIGRIIRAFEEWWISEDFPSNEVRLARALSDIVKAERH